MSHRGKPSGSKSKLGGSRRKDRFWPWVAVSVAFFLAVAGVLLIALYAGGK
jgi:hypothetical protein